MALCTKILSPVTNLLNSYRSYNGTTNTKAIERTRCFGLLLLISGLILSIYLIGFGIHAYKDVGYFSYIIGGNAVYYSTCAMILLGGTMFVIIPLGFYSILTADTMLVTVYMFLSFATVSLCAVGGVLGYLLREYTASTDLTDWMNTAMLREYGNPEAAQATPAFDRLHSQLDCCGLNNISWIETDWFYHQPELPRQRIPTSCCATCATIHEKFCTAFFINNSTDETALKLQKICLTASEKCTRADTTIANKEICLSNVLTPDNLSQSFRHTESCTPKVIALMEFYTNRMIFYNIMAGIQLFSYVITWLFLHELTFLYNPIPAILLRK